MQHEQIQSNLTPQHDPKCHSKNIKTENVLDKLFKRVSSFNKQNIKNRTRNRTKRKRRKSRTECQTNCKLVNKVEHHLVLRPLGQLVKECLKFQTQKTLLKKKFSIKFSTSCRYS